MFFFALRPALLLAALASLAAGCATDGAGTSTGGASPLAGAARAIGVATTDPTPAEFVRASRPAAPPDFIPVGVTPPPRTEAKRDPEALKKLEQELDGQRTRSRTYSARPKPPSSYDGKIPPRPMAPPAAPAAE